MLEKQWVIILIKPPKYNDAMSAWLQFDNCMKQIILKGFDLLKYRPIFEDYDDNRSYDMEYLSAILHTNELQ